MIFTKRTDAVEVSEVVEYNVGMPIHEFLEEKRDPYIKNIPEAVAMVKEYMSENPDGLISCVGDYDVDGGMATSIVHWTFQKLGKDIKMRIPHRMSEGYGLSEKIIDEISGGLVITVDNGITAIPAINKAKEKGIKVIVIDHHLPAKDGDGNIVLPPADIIIDPHIEDESDFKPFCGAALAYFFAKAMFPESNLYPLQVLASLATVTDVMPLVSYNRTLVRDGLKLMNSGKNVPGIAELLKAKEIFVATEEDYGFTLGPIFNAPGRLMDNGGNKVLEVVCSKRSNPMLPWIVQGLIDINEQRKSIVAESMVIADELVTDERPIVIYHPSFKEGIVGIIAGQLAEKYNTPAIVLTMTEDGKAYKGSGRSTDNINLKAGLDKIQSTMLGYGGHAGAAGLSVLPEKFDEFKRAFIENVGTEKPKGEDVEYDLDITENDILEMADEVAQFAPYGEGNPKPIFHLTLDLSAGKYAVMGDGTHFSIELPLYKVMGFGMVKKYEEMGKPSKIEATCYISHNWYKETRTVQVELIEFREV